MRWLLCLAGHKWREQVVRVQVPSKGKPDQKRDVTVRRCSRCGAVEYDL